MLIQHAQLAKKAAGKIRLVAVVWDTLQQLGPHLLLADTG